MSLHDKRKGCTHNVVSGGYYARCGASVPPSLRMPDMQLATVRQLALEITEDGETWGVTGCIAHAHKILQVVGYPPQQVPAQLEDIAKTLDEMAGEDAGSLTDQYFDALSDAVETPRPLLGIKRRSRDYLSEMKEADFTKVSETIKDFTRPPKFPGSDEEGT